MITTGMVHGEYILTPSLVARYKNALDKQEEEGVEYESVEKTDE